MISIGASFLQIIAGFLQSVVPLAYVVLVPLLRVSAKQLAGGALALRAAAAARDSLLAPVAETLSRTLEQEPVPILPAQFGPLHRPNRALASDEALSGGFLLFIGVVFLPVLVIAIAATPMTAYSDDWQLAFLILCCAAIGVAAVAFGAIFLRQAWRMRCPQVVTADELGLHWMRFYPRRREVHLPWSEISSFFTVAYLSGLATSWAFVVNGSNASLAWHVQLRAEDDILLASDQLSSIVLARTRLPLLDLSKAAELAGTSRTERRYKEAVELYGAPNSAGGPLWPDMLPPVS
ncbi:MAG TPA: hypothetical protein VGS80_18150, partial [Ktedonobacterales bacterium]|nr:hypothetical protein [Ktedonobacterales bacterium]